MLRFGMRALGVREDIPFPGSIYAATGPLVQPFYSMFPVSPRFDHPAVEIASLAAVVAIVFVALAVYACLLVAGSVLRGESSS